jgi:hypothetical protein
MTRGETVTRPSRSNRDDRFAGSGSIDRFGVAVLIAAAQVFPYSYRRDAWLFKIEGPSSDIGRMQHYGGFTIGSAVVWLLGQSCELLEVKQWERSSI